MLVSFLFGIFNINATKFPWTSSHLSMHVMPVLAGDHSLWEASSGAEATQIVKL